MTPSRQPVFSLGTKMALLATLLLAFSFGTCAVLVLALAGHGVRENLETRISEQSGFLALASQSLVAHATDRDREQLRKLSQQLLQEPAVLSIEVLNRNRHILAHVTRSGRRTTEFFVLQFPIRQETEIVGWIRAWYSPILALQDWSADTRYLLLLLFCGTLALFAAVFFVINERMLSRPFRRFFRAIDEAASRGRLQRLTAPEGGEWEQLSERLNGLIGSVLHAQERTDLLYQSSRLLGAPPGLNQRLEPLFSAILHRYNLNACAVLAEQSGGDYTAEFAAGMSAELARQLQVRPGEGTAGVALASGQMRIVNGSGPAEGDAWLRSLFDRLQVRSAMFLPLRAQGRTTGLAIFLSKDISGFTEDVTSVLMQLGDHLALALENSRRVASLEGVNRRLESEVATTVRELSQTNQRLVQKVRELKTVYDLALATAASSSVEDIVRVIIGGVKELVEVRAGAFFRYSKSSGMLEPFAPAFDLPAKATANLACSVSGSPFLQRVISTRQPQILNFVDASERLPDSWQGVSIRSILVLPLHQEDEVTGLFCVVNKLNGLFTEDDVRLLSLLTSRVNEVLRRLALDQQLHQRVNDLSVLQEIASQLPSPPVLSDTVGSIGRISRQGLAGSDLCLFFVHHVESEALVMVGGDWDARLAFDARALTTGTSEKVPLADAFGENRLQEFQRGSTDPRWQNDPLVSAFDLNELYYFPLTVEKGRIGVLAIGCGGAKRLSGEDRRLAGLIAKQVAVVIERSRLYERLRSANEKLEQINHLKNEFISMVSHELRTPLTTIKGFVSIVLNEETGPLNDQQRHFLETSDRAIDRLTLLVSDLLDISRIEAGQIKMQLRPVQLQDVVSRVAANFAPQLKAQGLTLTVRFGDHVPLVLADPDRLGQVFDNLLSNALKFTAEGGITISATDKGDFVMVSVKDTGSGIAKEEQDRIFEKFYQIKVGNAYPSKGTGLGLAIVRSIIESHRGKVWVESEAGSGADFRFILPRARTESMGDGGAVPSTVDLA